MKKNLEAFLLAITFLTRLPLPLVSPASTEVFGLALGYMPLVGAVIGVLCGICVIAAAFLFQNAPLAAFSGIVFNLILTGALHEDGLADCADGLVGGHTKEKRLEIMKDSSQGTYGVAALWSILTAELLLLTCLLKDHFWGIMASLVVANSLGRVSILALATYLPYARVENSRSSSFFESPSTVIFILGSVPVFLLSALLLQERALFCIGACGIVTVASGGYFMKKIGGFTGDCLGAASKLTQVACYVVILIDFRFRIPWTHL